MSVKKEKLCYTTGTRHVSDMTRIRENVIEDTIRDAI